jgi:hypothetical protein
MLNELSNLLTGSLCKYVYISEPTGNADAEGAGVGANADVEADTPKNLFHEDTLPPPWLGCASLCNLTPQYLDS